MSFIKLLIHTCDIQAKTPSLEGYEQVEEWNNIASSVMCRHNSSNTPKIQDGVIRENNDDDIFFFAPDVSIERGNRINFNSGLYDVIKVNRLFDSKTLHHLEVRARLVDTN